MFMTCKKDEIQAEDSIEGVWDIIEITTLYAEFFETSFDPSETTSFISPGAISIGVTAPYAVRFSFESNT